MSAANLWGGGRHLRGLSWVHWEDWELSLPCYRQHSFMLQQQKQGSERDPQDVHEASLKMGVERPPAMAAGWAKISQETRLNSRGRESQTFSP